MMENVNLQQISFVNLLMIMDYVLHAMLVMPYTMGNVDHYKN